MALNFSQLSVCLYGYKPSWIIKRNFLSQPQYRLVWLKFFLVAFYLDLFCFASLTLQQCNLRAKNIYQLISPLYLLHWISLVSQKWFSIYLNFILVHLSFCELQLNVFMYFHTILFGHLASLTVILTLKLICFFLFSAVIPISSLSNLFQPWWKDKNGQHNINVVWHCISGCNLLQAAS